MPQPTTRPAKRNANPRRPTDPPRTHAGYWRTEATLATVIIKLAATKPSTHLSVENIVNEAQINRSTFYTHTPNPTTLLTTALRATLPTPTPTPTTTDPRTTIKTALTPLITHLNTHTHIYRTAQTDPAAAGALFRVLTEHLATQIQTALPADIATITAAAAIEACKHTIETKHPLNINDTMNTLDIALGLQHPTRPQRSP